jgi:hypothetical protein
MAERGKIDKDKYIVSIHGIDTLIVGSWVKVTLRTQTSLLSEMMQSFKCCPHVSKMPEELEMCMVCGTATFHKGLPNSKEKA